MEKIAKKLTDYYMRTGLINEKDAAIYQFGWQVSIEILISIIASIGIALYLKMFPEMIFLGGIFIPLRTWAGGVHLDRYWKCFVCSVMIMVVGLVSSKYIHCDETYSFVCICGLLLIISGFGVCKNSNVKERYKESLLKKLRAFELGIAIVAVILKLRENGQYLFLTMYTLAVVLISLLLKDVRIKRDGSISLFGKNRVSGLLKERVAASKCLYRYLSFEKDRGSFNKKAGFDNFGCTGSEIKGRRTGIYNKNSLQK